MTVFEVLTKMYELIDNNGHAKGCHQRLDGSLCLIGAWFKAVEPDVEVDNEGMFMPRIPYDETLWKQTMFYLGFAPYESVALWNDNLSTTKSQVLERIQNGIDLAKKEEK